ncbi:hypothetical protein TWF718_009305 [Orbilia javanica]|uniref:DUF4219 domain-containing protein n=1 Tax=Orbilia javanica TaxID=47235 RepID=A0AAN8NSS1_9PEZI
MANNPNPRFPYSVLRSAALPQGLDEDMEEHSTVPKRVLTAPTPVLPSSIYPSLASSNEGASNPYQIYNNTNITQRPVYKSTLESLAEESSPQDRPAALATGKAEPATAPIISAPLSTHDAIPKTSSILSPSLESLRSYLTPSSLALFAQSCRNAPDSSTGPQFYGSKYAQPSWSGPAENLSLPFQNTLRPRHSMPNLEQHKYSTGVAPPQGPGSLVQDSRPLLQQSAATLPPPGFSKILPPPGLSKTLPPPGLSSTAGAYPSLWSPSWMFPDETSGNEPRPASQGLTSQNSIKQASFDGPPPGEVFTNLPIRDEGGVVTNPHTPNQSLAELYPTNRQVMGGATKIGQVLQADPGEQEGTPESVLRGLRLNFSLDPISMIEKGHLPVLDGNNFPEWAITMQRYLKAEGLWPSWETSKKYELCPNSAIHLRSSREFYSCNQPECVRRDRIDAAGLLILIMACDKNNRSLLMRQNTIETAWLLLEKAHVCGIYDHNPEFSLFHPTAVLANTKSAPLDDHKLSDFLMTAYKQWCFYLYLVENHGDLTAIRPEYLSETVFLAGVFNHFPDRSPYVQIKRYWQEKLQNGDQEFSQVYGWTIAMERGELGPIRLDLGIHRMPGPN